MSTGNSTAEMEPITVGYWSIRGLGAPLRQMVMYSGRKLNNVMHDLKENDGKFDGHEWFSLKVALKEKNALMNLPYVIDGDIMVTQSNACFAYLGRKLNLWGNSEIENIRCEELLCEIMDIRNSVIDFAYIPNTTAETASAHIASKTNHKSNFAKTELFLERAVANDGASGTFLVGDHATAPDFHLYEMIYQVKALASYFSLPDPFESLPRLNFFFNSFEKLPNNAAYMKSNIGGRQIPFNNKMAGFGGSPDGGKWVNGQPYDYHNNVGIY